MFEILLDIGLFAYFAPGLDDRIEVTNSKSWPSTLS
jgi:hypothetical protein